MTLILGDYHLPHLSLAPTGPFVALANLAFLQTFLVKTIAFNSVLWTLAVEVAYYVVTPLFPRNKSWLFVSILFLSVFIFVLPFRSDWGLIYSYVLKLNVVRFAWPFMFGYALYQYRNPWMFLVIALVSAALAEVSDMTPGFLAPLTVSVTIGMMFISMNLPTKLTAFDYMGDVSYPLYVFQIPIFITCYAIFGLTNNALLYLAAVIGGMIVYECVDRRLKPLIFAGYSSAPLEARAAPPAIEVIRLK